MEIMEMKLDEFLEYVFRMNCEECEFFELEDCELQCMTDIRVVD